MSVVKALALVVLLLLSSRQAEAQVSPGVVKKGLSVDSKVLGKQVRYTIYLPFDYETSTQSYPVVYLLHGGGGNDVQWIESGEADLTTDKAIANRQIPPVILVMPDAGFTRYINSYDNAVRYEDFFFKEFIPSIEATYRVNAQKRFRAVGGLSMGGYGALIYALRHPEMFAACVALSAALYTDEMTLEMSQSEWDRSRTVAFGKGLKGQSRITNHYKAYDPFRIVSSGDPEKLRMVKFYLDCGDDDFRNDGNAAFHILLRRMKIPHEYRVRDGDHTWTYWRSGLSEGLRFFGDIFREPNVFQ
jgi:enterochelin esterase-like enzyme